MHEVGQNRFGAQLPQECGYLSAVIRSVVYQVLHRLPERILVYAEPQRFVFHHAIEVRLGQATHEIQQPGFELIPAGFEGCHVAELRGVWQRRWRATLKAFEPEPFGSIDMSERIANRAKARAQCFCELIRRELRSRLQLPAICPGVVLVERSYVLRCHDPAPWFDAKRSVAQRRKEG